VLNNLSVPTDNVFKFYALFSLVGLLFCFGSIIVLGDKTNEIIFSHADELELLKVVQSPNKAQQIRLATIQKKVDIAVSNHKFLIAMISLGSAISVFGMAYGFRRWHTNVQRPNDEAARVQLETSRLQLAKLKAELLAQGVTIK
jgi:chromosome condensin MukBEF MukE localization factor